jgi:Holliday junction resolvasome RuvABC DNA-binding subunit
MKNPTNEMYELINKAEYKLFEAIKESGKEDITKICTDLRDYWDTLEVGK